MQAKGHLLSYDSKYGGLSAPLHVKGVATKNGVNHELENMRAQGLEPWTYGLKVRCSTN